MKELMLGNHAVARGAYEAGVKVLTAYPGTPSTEIAEEITKYDDIYAEWSPNEKVALEVAIGASIAGARAMCCMKHVGVNVAADPLFTFSYTGVNGGLVLVCADDPAMHSSQNEQDSRYYALSAHVPMLEPSDSQQAKDFVIKAFELSEKYDTPVMLRLTTRVSHSQSFVQTAQPLSVGVKPYVKNVEKYVMVPANAKKRHIEVEKRMLALGEHCNGFDDINVMEKGGDIGVICSGNVYQYVKEALPSASVLKLGMVNPLPKKLIEDFAESVSDLIICEELEPFIETQVKAMGIKCRGKELFTVLGEYSAAMIRKAVTGESLEYKAAEVAPRPPVMCAGCPHRPVFYVLSKLKYIVSGDIGCYSLGSGKPLNAIDAVMCMGASVGMAHGIEKANAELSKKTVAIIGDSTFIHSGITGLINAAYNGGSLTLIILDNSTTGMTGHQDHPATGYTLKKKEAKRLNLESICHSCGADSVRVVDAYDMAQIEKAVREEAESDRVSVIIARRPCVLLEKKTYKPYKVYENCTGCKVCLKIGCPAISFENGKSKIDASSCTGCGVCGDVCRFGAMKEA
jgi:indolepyruvate ferredoxin oxidoreductase alpha subunit